VRQHSTIPRAPVRARRTITRGNAPRSCVALRALSEVGRVTAKDSSASLRYARNDEKGRRQYLEHHQQGYGDHQYREQT
jgi:hypothetical protein